MTFDGEETPKTALSAWVGLDWVLPHALPCCWRRIVVQVRRPSSRDGWTPEGGQARRFDGPKAWQWAVEDPVGWLGCMVDVEGVRAAVWWPLTYCCCVYRQRGGPDPGQRSILAACLLDSGRGSGSWTLQPHLCGCFERPLTQTTWTQRRNSSWNAAEWDRHHPLTSLTQQTIDDSSVRREVPVPGNVDAHWGLDVVCLR